MGNKIYLRSGTGITCLEIEPLSVDPSGFVCPAVGKSQSVIGNAVTSACNRIRNSSWGERVARDERRNGSLPTMDQILKPREN